MSRLELATRDPRQTFRPGEGIDGTVAWNLDELPTSVELALFWYTEGKGDRDVGEVQRVAFENPGREDRRDFRVELPAAGPLSFSGQLVSLIWALELVVEPGEQTRRLEILVSSTGQEIRLPKVADALDDAPAWAKSLAEKIGKRAGKDASAG